MRLVAKTFTTGLLLTKEPSMARRPASIVMLGILHLFGGVLGLFCCTGCGGFLQISNAHLDLLKGNNQAAAGQVIRPGASRFEQSSEMGMAIDFRLVKAVPSYRIYTILNVLVSFFLDILLIISGIGLLLMAGWGRTLSIVYAVLSLLTKLVFFTYLVAFVIAPLLSIMDQELAIAPPQIVASAFAFRPARLGRDCAGLVFFFYPVVVLAVLLHPATAKAFTASKRGEDSERTSSRRWEDSEDNPSLRRQREDDETFR
jgi:hypothetical protein